MQRFLTNKAITITDISPSSFKLQDVLGNIKKINKKYDTASLENEYGIKPFFIQEVHAKPTYGINEQFSLIVNQNPLESLRKRIHDLLTILRQIEDLAFHLVSNHIIDDDILHIFRQDNELRIHIKEGKIDHLKYEHVISDLAKKNRNICNGLLVKTEIARIGDLIRTELCHSEFSIIQSVNFLSTLISLENDKKKFVKNSERLCHGYCPDATTWSFIDSIKAISTTLDMLSKLVKLIDDTNSNIVPKTKNVIFGNLSYQKHWNKFCSKRVRNDIERVLEKLKLVIRLRHDLTHNSGLYPLQNFSFVGFGTPCVKNIELAYADSPFWDHNGKFFDSSQKQVGFFSQQNNTIDFAVNNIIATFELVEKIFKLLRFELINKCKSNGITYFNTLEWQQTSITVNSYTLDELEKLFLL
jgi:hypothetical protein